MSANKPLYEKIYTALRFMIESGQYSSGALLPTEKELASEYGVSRITASRALQILAAEGLVQRRPGKGSVVIDAKFPLGKREFITGQPTSLRQPTIGFIIPQISEWYGLGIVSSVAAASDDHDALMVYSQSNGEQEREERLIQKLIERGVDGLIVYPVNGEYYNPEILRLHLNGFPMVLIDRYLKKIPVPSITTDNHSASYVLTTHLIELGHRSIGYLSPSIEGTGPLEDRSSGFLAAMRDANIAVDPERIVTSFPTGPRRREEHRQRDLQQIRTFLERHPEVTAVIATEHQLAAAALEASHLLGRGVPDDLSVACFDGTPKVSPMFAITHIHQDQSAMGREAVEMLMQLIQGAPAEEVIPRVLHADLVVGSTTAAPRRSDVSVPLHDIPGPA